MTCTVGMVWDKNNCVGNPVKVKLDQIYDWNDKNTR